MDWWLSIDELNGTCLLWTLSHWSRDVHRMWMSATLHVGHLDVVRSKRMPLQLYALTQ